MSIKIMSRIWENVDQFPYGGSRLTVALAIADYANDLGIAWPAQSTLATKARISERQVIRIIKDLVMVGQLASFPRYKGDGSPSSNVYIVLTSMNRQTLRDSLLAIRELGARPDKMSYMDLDIGGDKMSDTPCHGRQGGGDTDVRGVVTPMSDDPSLEPLVEPSIEESGADAPPYVPRQDLLQQWFGPGIKVVATEGILARTADAAIASPAAEGILARTADAAVASPVAEDPVPEKGAPEWETMMRKGMKGRPVFVAGGFTVDDVVAVCRRFYDLTGNPVPAHNKGNSNWRNGAEAVIESFYGSLKTLYESKGQELPTISKQRRLLLLCIDLFFVPGSGYDHIKAATPRSLANSMAGLLSDLIDIHRMFRLNGELPSKTHINGWIATKDKGGRSAKKERGARPVRTDEGIRGPSTEDVELAAQQRAESSAGSA